MDPGPWLYSLRQFSAWAAPSGRALLPDPLTAGHWLLNALDVVVSPYAHDGGRISELSVVCEKAWKALEAGDHSWLHEVDVDATAWESAVVMVGEGAYEAVAAILRRGASRSLAEARARSTRA